MDPKPDTTDGRPVILLVDDDVINQRVVGCMLGKMGCTVIRADDGAVAVDICTTSYVDLVLMDVQMPMMDGCEATRRIRAAQGPHTRRIPIIGLSAFTFPEDIQAGLAAGMDAYLAKPILPHALSEALMPWLGGRARSIAAPAALSAEFLAMR